MRVALIHDWLTGMRGGEKILECLCEIYPEAHIYTLLHIKNKLSETIEEMRIHTSFIQSLPFLKSKYRNYLPLFPTAIESFNLSNYDMVISCSHCVAKGAITLPGTCHIAYILTPMRYVWDMYDDYFGKDKKNRSARFLVPFFANHLRNWDVVSSNRPDYLLAISKYVAQRTKKFYRKDSEVIYPPVDTDLFNLNEKKDDFYLIVSAFAPNKRIDLAIEAFNRLGLPLIIIGIGQEEKYLKSIARAKNIEFLGWQTSDKLGEYYSRAKGFILPGIEDFGITPLEAQASGTPVIAFGKGGVLETVMPTLGQRAKGKGQRAEGIGQRAEGRGQRAESRGQRAEGRGQRAKGKGQRAEGREQRTPTGIFFYEQSVDALCEAVKNFEDNDWDYKGIRENALRFDREIFKEKIYKKINRLYEKFKNQSH